MTQRDELSNILGETVADIIKEQKKCEEEYEALVKQRSELKSLSNKTKYKQNQEKIQAKARELQEMTSDLCKRLRESPNVSENLMKIQGHRSSLITMFESFRNELMTKRSFQGIAAKAAKKKARYDNMLQIVQTDKEMQRQINELQANIQKTEHEMQEKIERLDAQIKEQKELLLQKQSDNSAEKAQRDDERNAHLAAIIKTNKLAESKLAKQMETARLASETEQNVYRETLSFFARREGKVRAETQNWQEKYDTNTTREARTLKELTDRIEKATREFISLKPRKEESAKNLVLETVRDKGRTQQTENYSQQERFMEKLKLLFVLHCKVVPPVVPKRGRRRG